MRRSGGRGTFPGLSEAGYMGWETDTDARAARWRVRSALASVVAVSAFSQSLNVESDDVRPGFVPGEVVFSAAATAWARALAPATSGCTPSGKNSG